MKKKVIELERSERKKLRKERHRVKMEESDPDYEPSSAAPTQESRVDSSVSVSLWRTASLTVTQHHTSPGSQWSDESSGEDVDPLYTSLTPSLLPPAELWSTSPPQNLLAL
ncbi:hypothetical protein WMY93_007354 [Mugilogobius chulae]|uniref:Uncharacterized protein n=1 Tax=Mugilogobius chulae TaxID=88201 RepID=A0AAW0PJ88_9GOBI